MTVRELITKWGFEVEHDKLDKVERQLDSIKERLEFLAAAEVVKGLYELAERFSKVAEEIHVAAESAGITVEAFQRLTFAASQSAVSQESMSTSLRRLSHALYEARTGSQESLMAFQRIGISDSQIMSFRNSEQALMAMADRFKSIQDPIQKQAIAQQLLGRGAGNMVAFLSKGSDAIKGLGMQAQVLSDAQIEANVKIEHSFQRLANIFKVVGGIFASYLSPSIEHAVNDFTKFYEVNKKIIEQNIRDWVWDVTYALGFVYQAMKFVIQTFLDFAGTHSLLVRRVSELLVALGGVVFAIFAVQKAVSLLTGSLGLLQWAFGIIMTVAEVAFIPMLWVAGLAQTALIEIISSLAVLALESFPALGVALGTFSAMLEATPVGWFMTAVAALVVVLHDAWTLLTGGSFKDTWISQAFEAAKGMGGKIASFFGFGESDNKQANAVTNLQNVQDMATSGVPGIMPGTPGAAVANSNNTYSVNAPVSISVPAGTDHKTVEKSVKEGITEHLDRVYRETQRSLAGVHAY